MKKITPLSQCVKFEYKSSDTTRESMPLLNVPIKDTVSFKGSLERAVQTKGDRLIQMIEGLNLIDIGKTVDQLAKKIIKPAQTVSEDFKKLCARVYGDVPHKIRIKTPSSIAPKISGRLSPESFTMKEAMNKITDLQGGMGITNGTKEESNAIVKKIIKELLNGNIRQITSIRNYQGPFIEPYLSKRNIIQLQKAQEKRGDGVKKILDGERAYTKNGYPGAHITGITREGLPFEFQIKGKHSSKIDPATHIIHDLEVGKESLRNYPSANGRKLLKPVITAYDSLNSRQYKEYNEYIRKSYCIARECELSHAEFFNLRLPKGLPAELSIENLNKVAEQLK